MIKKLYKSVCKRLYAPWEHLVGRKMGSKARSVPMGTPDSSKISVATHQMCSTAQRTLHFESYNLDAFALGAKSLVVNGKTILPVSTTGATVSVSIKAISKKMPHLRCFTVSSITLFYQNSGPMGLSALFTFLRLT